MEFMALPGSFLHEECAMAINNGKRLTSYIATLLTCWIFVVAQQSPSYTTQTKPTTKQIVVVWDLGDTLVTVDRKELTAPLSKLTLAHAWLSSAVHFKKKDDERIPVGKRMRSAFYYELDQIMPGNKLIAYDDRGEQLPQLLAAWQLGTHSCAQLLNVIRSHEKNKKNKVVSRVSAALATCTIDPLHFTKCVRPISSMLELLQKFAETKKVKNYVLSNWNNESFKLLPQYVPEIFKYIDGSICSGDIHCAKPHPDIYDALIARMQQDGIDTDKSTIIFIDDREENRIAAPDNWICFDPSERKIIKKFIARQQR